MKIIINTIFQGIGLFSLFFIVFYFIPYTIRKAWGDAENRTKKVCDICFRDIKKVNDLLTKPE